MGSGALENGSRLGPGYDTESGYFYICSILYDMREASKVRTVKYTQNSTWVANDPTDKTLGRGKKRLRTSAVMISIHLP